MGTVSPDVHTWCTLVSRHKFKPSTENQPCEAQPSFLLRRPQNHTHAWPSRLNLAKFSLLVASGALRFHAVFHAACERPTRDVPCHGLDEQLPQRRVQRRWRARPWVGVRNACLRHRLHRLWPARLHAIAASAVTSSASGTPPTAKHLLESMHRPLPQPGWQLNHRPVRHLPRCCMHSRWA